MEAGTGLVVLAVAYFAAQIGGVFLTRHLDGRLMRERYEHEKDVARIQATIKGDFNADVRQSH